MDAAITMHVGSSPADFDALAGALRGRLLRPADDDFAADSAIWNVARQGRPLAIVRAADAGDVATVIGFAARSDIEIAVRAGGHSLAGHSTGDGTLVIDLRDLRGLHIDPKQRIAWVGAGLTAGEVTAAAAEHGLAIPFGDTASVGVGGLTLGGGIGWLARLHGLTVDSLIAAEIVTADGELRTISEADEPDLFWAIRGGGGNFGVVTRFSFRLHPVDQVLGGALFMPLTRDVLRSLVPIASSAPDALTTISFIMAAPPVPFVPEEHHGKPSVAIMFVYAGDPAEGQAAIAPFRAVASPYGEGVMPMPYQGIYQFTAEGEQPHPSTTRSLFMDVLDDASIDAILEACATAPPASMVQLRTLGGAMGRVPVDATAFAHRGAAVQVAIINAFPEREMVDGATAWNRGLFAALEPKGSGVYANFLEDEGEDRIRQAYPGGTYERLAQVKRRYDPRNLFHRNQNIRPS